MPHTGSALQHQRSIQSNVSFDYDFAHYWTVLVELPQFCVAFGESNCGVRDQGGGSPFQKQGPANVFQVLFYHTAHHPCENVSQGARKEVQTNYKKNYKTCHNIFISLWPSLHWRGLQPTGKWLKRE